MHAIPAQLRRELSQDSFYRTCARKDLFGHICAGRITWEHALVHAGRQIQARWAILPVCAKGHAVDGFQDAGDMQKDLHVWIALNRASNEELQSISAATDYRALRDRLNAKYGTYQEPLAFLGINYPWLAIL